MLFTIIVNLIYIYIYLKTTLRFYLLIGHFFSIIMHSDIDLINVFGIFILKRVSENGIHENKL